MAGHGGGAWKVAYADFVTAMMAFFMVMWITSQGKDVKEAVAQYFREPYSPDWRGAKPGTPLPNKPGASGKKRVKGHLNRGRGPGGPGIVPPADEELDGPDAPRPKMVTIHDGNRSSIGAVIPFAEDSADLDETAAKRLRRLTPTLVGKRNKIEIRGHTSRRPLPPESPFKDPWQLSYARSLAVLKFLEQQGVEPARIRLSQAGVFEPQTIREESDRVASNARVEVYMLGEFADDLVGTREERAGRFGNP